MRTSLCVIVAILMIAAPAGAQETRGKILGTVEDPQGVVPQAVVTMTNVDTKTSTQVTTNGQGYFEAPLLQPGTYDVAVEMQGFKTATRTGVRLAVAQQVSLSFNLEVGQISESVIVTAEAPLLDTTSVTSSANFDAKLVGLRARLDKLLEEK